MSNGNGNGVLEHELLQHSVTRAEKEAQHPEGGVVKFYIGAYSGGMSTQITTLPELPPFWSFVRDRILVSTVTAESRWAQAIGIAVMKTVTREWDVSGEVPATRLDKARRRVKSLLAPSQRSPLVTDYLLRDNGAWAEIIRPTSQPTGVLGLGYLDSGRCMPTGDPNIPVVYWDRLGHPHEMRDYQVMRFVDMPDGSNPFRTGMCAARRAYNDIRQTAATQRFRLEKIQGNNPKSIYFVSGVSPKQVKDLKLDHQQNQEANNIVAFGGVLISAFIQREGIEVKEIPIAALPDGFDYKTEMQGTALAYANAIPGITYLDLMPMTGQRAGSSAQSQVVDDQSIMKDTFAANLTDALNEDDLWKIMPEQVRWYMKGNDLADRKRMADITVAFANAAGVLVSKCGFEPQVIQDWLIDNEILNPDNSSEQFSVLSANEPVGQVQSKPLKKLSPPAPAGAAPTPATTGTKEAQDAVLQTLADTLKALATRESIGAKQVAQIVEDTMPQFHMHLPETLTHRLEMQNVPAPNVYVTNDVRPSEVPVNVVNNVPQQPAPIVTPTINLPETRISVQSATPEIRVIVPQVEEETKTIEVAQRDSNGFLEKLVQRTKRTFRK